MTVEKPDDELAPHRFIRAWRKHKRITQEDMAAAVGLSPPSISMIENGRQGVTLTQLAEIASALGITLPQLLQAPPSAKDQKAEELRQEILKIYDSLPPHLQPVYLAQARALLGGAQAEQASATDQRKDRQ